MIEPSEADLDYFSKVERKKNILKFLENGDWKRLQDVSTPVFLIPSFNPSLFDPKFQPRMFFWFISKKIRNRKRKPGYFNPWSFEFRTYTRIYLHPKFSARIFQKWIQFNKIFYIYALRTKKSQVHLSGYVRA